MTAPAPRRASIRSLLLGAILLASLGAAPALADTVFDVDGCSEPTDAAEDAFDLFADLIEQAPELCPNLCKDAGKACFASAKKGLGCGSKVGRIFLRASARVCSENPGLEGCAELDAEQAEFKQALADEKADIKSTCRDLVADCNEICLGDL